MKKLTRWYVLRTIQIITFINQYFLRFLIVRIVFRATSVTML